MWLFVGWFLVGSLLFDQVVEFDGGVGKLKVGAHVGIADEINPLRLEVVEDRLDLLKQNGAFLPAESVDAAKANSEVSRFNQGQRLEFTFDEIHWAPLGNNINPGDK